MIKREHSHSYKYHIMSLNAGNMLDKFVVRCRICKTEFVIPDMGPCTDLEYEDYIKDVGFVCKCGKNDWQLTVD